MADALPPLPEPAQEAQSEGYMPGCPTPIPATPDFYTAEQMRAMYEAGKRAALSVQGEPVAHVGNSDFEGWFSTYSPAGKGDKQRARDAYAAGMSDPGAAPAAPAGWQWVPVEPTWEMTRAAIRFLNKPDPRVADIDLAYRAMLAAAPGAPQET